MEPKYTFQDDLFQADVFQDKPRKVGCNEMCWVSNIRLEFELILVGTIADIWVGEVQNKGWAWGRLIKLQIVFIYYIVQILLWIIVEIRLLFWKISNFKYDWQKLYIFKVHKYIYII